MKWVIVFTTICILFTSCKSTKAPVDQPNTGEEITFEIIESGAQSGFTQENLMLISDASSWENIWKSASSNRFPTPATPEVDFEKYQVIAACMGMRNTGGYEIKITSIQSADEVYEVNLSYVSPGKDCILTEALTYPYVIAKIERKGLEKIKNNINRQTVDCNN